jgi:hypothetical protein
MCNSLALRERKWNGGYIIVLDRDKAQRGIVCLISLFNHLTYPIALCESIKGFGLHREEAQ